MIPLPVISTPDITLNQLKDHFSAATAVTNFAQAMVTAVPQPSTMPDWFASIQTDIETLQANALQWLQKICPSINHEIPAGIIAFNSTFQVNSGLILEEINTMRKQQKGTATAAQQQLILAYLSAVRKSIGDQHDMAAATRETINHSIAAFHSDERKIVKDLTLISSKIPNSAASIDQLQAVISNDFLDTTTLGPCNAIVNIHMDITLKVTGLNSDPAIIPTVYAQAILQNLLDNIQLVFKSYQTLMDSWSIVLSKYDALITDLTDASSDQFAAELQSLDLTTARLQWQQLADYAATLQVHQSYSFS